MGNKYLGKKIRPKFLRSVSLHYKILSKNLVACKPAFYTIYTSHLRRNGAMRRCFYHTDLGQNAIFLNFAMQDKYRTHSIYTWARETIRLYLSSDTLFWQMPTDHNIDGTLMRNMCAISVCSWAPKLARKCEIKHWFPCGADGQALGVRSRSYAIFWDG